MLTLKFMIVVHWATRWRKFFRLFSVA